MHGTAFYNLIVSYRERGGGHGNKEIPVFYEHLLPAKATIYTFNI